MKRTGDVQRKFTFATDGDQNEVGRPTWAVLPFATARAPILPKRDLPAGVPVGRNLFAVNPILG